MKSKMAEFCGSSLLLALPEDVFAIISRSLSPRDLRNLSLCCRSSSALVASDKVWLLQCDMVGIVPHGDLIEWRKGVSSYKALCRFLVSVLPLLGIWVHQNPELGNVVYVMPGFVSITGCRIIPQELGPLGIEEGPILWAPVFEVIGGFDGSISFFLHGREKGTDYVYPGTVKSVEKNCNVLLLEVETKQENNESKLLNSKSFAGIPEKQPSRKLSRSISELPKLQKVLGHCEAKLTKPFSRLAFSDRRKLIEVVTGHVRQKLRDSVNGPLFPRLRIDDEPFQKDIDLLLQRRSMLLEMYNFGGGHINWKTASELPFDRRKCPDHSASHSSLNCDDSHKHPAKKTLSGYFSASLRQILGRSFLISGSRALSKSSLNNENKHAQLHEFLGSSDTIGLTLQASTMKLSSYRAWPNMHDSRFALYKIPMRIPRPDQEYAGLWGGTFGWPPGKPSEDKPGKALFILFISYDESEGQRHLIATKILEGTHYVLHPNGSAMFIVNMDEPSPDPFPWKVDADSVPVSIKDVFAGEGIANGYGFRYPGSKPGSLFIMENGLLAFIWRESRAVLTLERLNLEELLRKGERVPALPPVFNYSYLTKSYSNVFAGFANVSTCLSSPRLRRA